MRVGWGVVGGVGVGMNAVHLAVASIVGICHVVAAPNTYACLEWLRSLQWIAPYVALDCPL